jgi:hypothetical protein
MAKLMGQPPDVFVVGGRTFRLLRREPYTRKDGTETEVWGGAICRKCGDPFEVTTPVRTFERSGSFAYRTCRTCCA